MNEATAAQLRLLREMRDAFDDAGVRWWLFGGWALDVHAGEITREHSDIEAYVSLEDAERATAALERAGFVAWPALHPDEGRPFTKDGQEIGLWYLTYDAAGRTITPGRWSDWPWYPGSFDGPRGLLGDLELPAVTLECLLDTKSNFAKHPHGAPLREKDIADIERLRAMIGARQPSHSDDT
jgi:hypothetical protein